MLADAKFVFVVCQVGAEASVKEEMGRVWPTLRFAFSRPGFVTFKLPSALKLAVDFDSNCTLARTAGFSLGKVRADQAEKGASELWSLAANIDSSFDHLHVWQRDTALPGERGFEPGSTPLAQEIGEAIRKCDPKAAGGKPLRLNAVARPGQLVLDCVLVEPNEWWVGWHQASGPASRWPGGVPKFNPPAEVISRAYFKINEALEWSELPVKAGDRCAEIGSSPGGAVQALLERGLQVIGIDPAEMDDSILEHAHFTHIRKRAIEVKRREFRDVKWLFADANVSPTQTLDAVESIVTHAEVHVRGMLLTLKLSNWKLMNSLPAWIDRVRSWGYEQIATRQLAFNRREICLAASRTGRRS